MAASNLNLGKASGGVLNIQPADGTTTTSLVLPAINGTVVAADIYGNVLVTNSTGGLGYGTGAGGTATQPPSDGFGGIGKGSRVTLNKPSGQITMNNAALAAGATVAFILNNNLITSFADNVAVTFFNTYNTINYNVWASNNGVGMCYIFVRNISGGSLAEPLSINFSLIKGALS